MGIVTVMAGRDGIVTMSPLRQWLNWYLGGCDSVGWRKKDGDAQWPRGCSDTCHEPANTGVCALRRLALGRFNREPRFRRQDLGIESSPAQTQPSPLLCDKFDFGVSRHAPGDFGRSRQLELVLHQDGGPCRHHRDATSEALCPTWPGAIELEHDRGRKPLRSQV